MALTAEDFASAESLKSGGILYVFPAFQTVGLEQKIRRSAADELFRGSLVSYSRQSFVDFDRNWYFRIASENRMPGRLGRGFAVRERPPRDGFPPFYASIVE